MLRRALHPRQLDLELSPRLRSRHPRAREPRPRTRQGAALQLPRQTLGARRHAAMGLGPTPPARPHDPISSSGAMPVTRWPRRLPPQPRTGSAAGRPSSTRVSGAGRDLDNTVTTHLFAVCPNNSGLHLPGAHPGHLPGRLEPPPRRQEDARLRGTHDLPAPSAGRAQARTDLGRPPALDRPLRRPPQLRLAAQPQGMVLPGQRPGPPSVGVRHQVPAVPAARRSIAPPLPQREVPVHGAQTPTRSARASAATTAASSWPRNAAWRRRPPCTSVRCLAWQRRNVRTYGDCSVFFTYEAMCAEPRAGGAADPGPGAGARRPEPAPEIAGEGQHLRRDADRHERTPDRAPWMPRRLRCSTACSGASGRARLLRLRSQGWRGRGWGAAAGPDQKSRSCNGFPRRHEPAVRPEPVGVRRSRRRGMWT